MLVLGYGLHLSTNESIYEMQDDLKASERGMAKWPSTVEDKVLKSLVSIC